MFHVVNNKNITDDKIKVLVTIGFDGMKANFGTRSTSFGIFARQFYGQRMEILEKELQ